jgi:hypothetical protein
MTRRGAVLIGVVLVVVLAVGVAVTVAMRGVHGQQAQTPGQGGTTSPAACSSAGSQLGSPGSPGSLGSQEDPAVPGPTPEGTSPASVAAPSGPTQDPAAAAAGLRPVAQWDDLFQRQWQSERNTAEQLSHSRDSWDHYTLSYAIDALTADYLATGRQQAVDEALTLTENVVASAVPSNELSRSRYHDGYLGWSSAQQSGHEVPLYESYFWRYATSLLRVVGRTPALADDPGIGPRYQRLLAFAEHNIFDKWFARGADQNIFRSRTHLSAHWALIALNLSDITTDPARRARYQQIVTAIDRKLPNYEASLKGQMLADPTRGGAYFWSDVWASCARPGQDVAHGNGVIAYVVEAHDQDVDWTAADINGFVHTLSDVIWPRSGPGAAFVDGSGTGTGWFSDGFVKLGRYDAVLQRRLETHQPANGQFYANGALNAAILLCPTRAAASASSSSRSAVPGAVASGPGPVAGVAGSAPVCSPSTVPAQ